MLLVSIGFSQELPMVICVIPNSQINRHHFTWLHFRSQYLQNDIKSNGYT